MDYLSVMFLTLLLCSNSWAQSKLEEAEFLETPFNSIIMADSQIHNLLAPPHVFRTPIIDSVVEIATRPPHQDMFSIDTLKWSLQNYGQGKKIIYLGDALNIGCKNEWVKFTQAMEQYKVHSGYVLAPGNHDFTFYGSSAGSRSREKDLIRHWWGEACSEGPSKAYPKNIKEVVLTKDLFIKNYLEVLAKQSFLDKDNIKCGRPRLSPRQRFEKETKVKDCRFKSDDKNSFLQRVHFTLPLSDKVRYSYKALLVQEINISPKHKAILVDTTDYEAGPTLLFGALNMGGKKNSILKTLNPGINGSIQERQIKIIRSWMDKKTPYFLMGHHPLMRLDERSKERLAALRSDYPNIIYVSAHTHEGHLKNDDVLPELNIGSMTDHTPEFVEWGYSKNAIQVKRVKLGEDLLGCNFDQNLTGKPFGYMSYKKIRKKNRDGMFDHTMNIFHRAYFNVFEENSIWEGSELKMVLEEEFAKKSFCRRVGKRGKECQQRKYDLALKALKIDEMVQEKYSLFHDRITYGACQAVWATQAEETR